MKYVVAALKKALSIFLMKTKITRKNQGLKNGNVERKNFGIKGE